MLQDISPHIYDNAYTPRAPKPSDRLLSFSDAGLLCAVEKDRVTLPEIGDKTGQYLFAIDETAYFLWEGAPLPETEGYRYLPQRERRQCASDETAFACAAAESLWRWYRRNRFCGACGSPTEKGETERSLVCPNCGCTVYPKICPAVIVAVTDGDRLLMTKYANRPFKRWALVAGFSEIGESIEDTVRREVLEETGLRVENLRFYKSQPWVYTDSLLMGFYCDVAGSREIVRQESELSEAAWFSRSDLPTDHSADSLTGEMIEQFRRSDPTIAAPEASP
ncbi:MAG: NAD(+) diphosphatase [Oscillospiraceae bacterium]|nr:NAD(+) diphosphatase [Oscillospiraceae bacterium]